MSEASTASVDSLIDMIISAYHTTRLRDAPFAAHIRGKLGDRLTNAITALATDPAAVDEPTEAMIALQDAREYIVGGVGDDVVGKIDRALAAMLAAHTKQEDGR